jgi:hypothetical protein
LAGWKNGSLNTFNGWAMASILSARRKICARSRPRQHPFSIEEAMPASIMRSRKAVALALSVAVGFAAVACDDDEPTSPVEEEFTVTMNGANERPNPVTTTATGEALLSFTGTGPITYSVTVANLTSLPVGAHIHGPADPTGTAQIIAPLAPLAQVTSGALVNGSITSTAVSTISLDSLKVLLRNGKAYINIHTANFPDGEIRGTINIQN